VYKSRIPALEKNRETELQEFLLIFSTKLFYKFFFRNLKIKQKLMIFYRRRRPTVNKDSLLSQGNEILFITLLLFFALVKAGENSLKLGQSFLIFFAYK